MQIVQPILQRSAPLIRNDHSDWQHEKNYQGRDPMQHARGHGVGGSSDRVRRTRLIPRLSFHGTVTITGESLSGCQVGSTALRVRPISMSANAKATKTMQRSASL